MPLRVGFDLDGTVADTQALTVNTAGATTLGGTIGGATRLASLTTDAGGTPADAGRSGCRHMNVMAAAAPTSTYREQRPRAALAGHVVCVWSQAR